MAAPQDSKKYAHEIGKEFIRIQDEISITKLIEGTEAKTAQISASSNTGSKNYFAINWIGLDKTQYYIRLGYFLEFLQLNIIPSINSDTNVRLLKIDYDISTNLIYTLPRQLSSDPQVCIFKASYTTTTGQSYNLFPFIEDDFIRSDNFAANYGQIMNIYFSMDYILNEIESKKDDKGKISLYTILNSLCQGWNSSTGNYNSLEPVLEDTTIKLVDSVALPDRDDLLKELNAEASTETAFFDTFRYGTYSTGDKKDPNIPHAGFIRDLSFNTTVGSNLATMITIGATYKGYVVGEDATALSRMNAGLVDRFKETISFPETGSSEAEPPQTLEVKYQAAITSFNTYVDNLSRYEILKEAQDDYSSLQTQLLEYEQAYQVQIASQDYITKDSTINQSLLPASANGGFLPFDLSLTMDGLSGMKIYQKFSADTNFLPTNYPESLEFIIKGITHTISDNQWITNIESFAIPKNPFAVSGSLRSSGGDGSGGADNLTLLPEKYITSKDNNPFNLRPLQSLNQFNGSIGKKEGFNKGSSIGSFVVFDTLQNGIRAGMKNLSNYFTKYKRDTISKIINAYAPGGTPGQSSSRTSNYVNLITTYMKTNYDSSITADTKLTFNGAAETNQNNIKMFKILVKGILNQEGGLTSEVEKAINSFVISSLN